MIEYKLVTFHSRDQFVQECNNLINRWYEPIWWVCVIPNVFEYGYVKDHQYNQAFIKKTEE